MAAKKKPTTVSLFDWAGVSAPEPVVIAPPMKTEVVTPLPVVVANDQPAATAAVPEGVTRISDAEPFCEPHATKPDEFWVGRTRSEWTSAAVLFTRDELKKLYRRIGAALEVGGSDGSVA